MIDWNDQRLQQFGYLGLRARQVVEGFITGLHKSPFHGFSVEFSEHRQYNSGESTRFIDWKLFARADKLFVKRFEEETNLRCRLIIDGSASMLFPEDHSKAPEHQSKFQYSVFLAAVFMLIFRQQRDAVGLSLVNEGLALHTSARSTFIHHQFLMSQLQQHFEQVKRNPLPRTQLVSALHEIAERIHRRSMVLIFSDLFDAGHDPQALSDALQHLRHNGHEVILFHVLDRTLEEEFGFSNAPHKFIDLENHSVIRVRPAEIRDAYRKKFEDFIGEIRNNAPRYGIEYVQADISSDPSQVLMPFFARRRV